MLHYLLITLVAWCFVCFLYMTFLYSITIEELRQSYDIHATPTQKPSIAIACAFNYKMDEQRGEFMSASKDYISKWYASLTKQPNMKGVVLSNMFDAEFRDSYTTDQVHFIHIDPKTHPSFVNVQNSTERSINDQVYFVAEWFLNSTEGQYDYAVLTDMHDVAFNRDPFEYMRSIDQITGKSQLFVQTEYKPEYYAVPWIEFYWQNCFQEARGNQSIFYNSGIVGAQTTHLQSFLRRVNVMFLNANPHYICDMAIFGKVIERDYLDNVITGYPFHSKFKHEFDPEPGFDEVTYIKHK